MAVKVDNAAGMVDYFLEHGVFISKGVDRYVRVAIGPFTTEADMEKLFQVAKAWKEQG
jgi:selenocysteine lyase/cysteine desulfurase